MKRLSLALGAALLVGSFTITETLRTVPETAPSRSETPEAPPIRTEVSPRLETAARPSGPVASENRQPHDAEPAFALGDLESIEALARDPDPRSLEFLLHHASLHPDARIRSQFVFSTEPLAHLCLTHAYLRMTRSDESPEVRSLAAHALARREPDSHDVTSGLVDALRTERDPDVRRALIQALGYRRQDPACEALLALAGSDESGSLRVTALESLSRQSESSARDYLVRELNRLRGAGPSDEVARAIDETILQLEERLDVADLHR